MKGRRRTRDECLGDALVRDVKEAAWLSGHQIDQNDRNYDPDFQRKLRHIPAERLDALLNDNRFVDTIDPFKPHAN